MLSLTTLKQLTTSSVQRDVTLRGQLTLINLLSSAQQTVTCVCVKTLRHFTIRFLWLVY